MVPIWALSAPRRGSNPFPTDNTIIPPFDLLADLDVVCNIVLTPHFLRSTHFPLIQFAPLGTWSECLHDRSEPILPSVIASNGR
jgi:hypothetical protein